MFSVKEREGNLEKELIISPISVVDILCFAYINKCPEGAYNLIYEYIVVTKLYNLGSKTMTWKHQWL